MFNLKGLHLPGGFRLKKTPSPAHYEFQVLQFDTWKVGNPGQENSHVIGKSKYPDFAAKVLYGHGGQLVYEFYTDHQCSKGKFEIKPEAICGLKRDNESIWIELSAPPACYIGHQDTERQMGNMFLFGLGLPIFKENKHRAEFDKTPHDFTGGTVSRSRYHKIEFSTAQRCKNFTDKLVALAPGRFNELLRVGLEVKSDRVHFTAEEMQAMSSAGKSKSEPKKKRPASEALDGDVPVGKPRGRPAGSKNKVAKCAETGAANEAKQFENARQRGWVGSDGAKCDGCNTREDVDEFEICPRCHYTACDSCSVHHSRGTCHCKDSNMGDAYPKRREWYMSGKW